MSSESRHSVQTSERAPVTFPCDSVTLRDISCCCFKQTYLIVGFSEREAGVFGRAWLEVGEYAVL